VRAWRAATVGLLVFAQEPGIAEEAVNEPHYRLSAAALACFVQNREVYKAASGEPVFLLADRCPPKRPPSLLDALTNEGPDVRITDPDALDRLLTLNRAQLACLDRLSVTASDAVVLFFPDACRVEPFTAPP
jgi:hypothetical protein